MIEHKKLLKIDSSTSLDIDTTSDIAKVCLSEKCLTWPAQGRADELIAKIDKLLKSRLMTIYDVSAININLGPGSFNGTRVGLAVANALAWSLGKPINNLAVGKMEILKLARPNFTAAGFAKGRLPATQPLRLKRQLPRRSPAQRSRKTTNR